MDCTLHNTEITKLGLVGWQNESVRVLVLQLLGGPPTGVYYSASGISVTEVEPSISLRRVRDFIVQTGTAVH